MKRIRLLAAVAVVGLTSLFGIATATAPAAIAATTASSHIAASKAPVESLRTNAPQIPATRCPFIPGHFVVYYNSGCTSNNEWQCHSGTSSSLSQRPYNVSNSCSYRVWLYQYSNLTGDTLCITRGTRTGYLQRVWRAFWISFNTSNC
jgi:hypothetical protein